MRIGIALRSTVFGPSLVAKLVPWVEESGFDSVWFPSVGRAFDALDMCGISLGKSTRLNVGTGVIKYLDYDKEGLIARAHTLSEGSGGRFVLGIGTGSDTGGRAVERLVSYSDSLRSDYPRGPRLPIYFAALKGKILRAAFLHADGAILNFCSSSYVRRIAAGRHAPGSFTLGCYIKLFFAKEDAVANKMLAGEIRMYDAIPQYHRMFEQMGVAADLRNLDPRSIPDQLFEVSLANPSDQEVTSMLKGFSAAGVDLPILYPYVSGDEEYKRTIVKRLGACSSG